MDVSPEFYAAGASQQPVTSLFTYEIFGNQATKIEAQVTSKIYDHQRCFRAHIFTIKLYISRSLTVVRLPYSRLAYARRCTRRTLPGNMISSNKKVLGVGDGDKSGSLFHRLFRFAVSFYQPLNFLRSRHGARLCSEQTAPTVKEVSTTAVDRLAPIRRFLRRTLVV